MIERLVEIEPARYHLLDAGHGEPLLLLHGFTGSAQSWSHVISALVERNHVLAPDLPGHGLTETPNEPSAYAISRVAADLAGLLDRLSIPSAHVLGYSMGGRLALAFAVLFPQRVNRLTLESASPGLASADERAARAAADEALAARIECDGVACFVDEWERLPLFSSQASLPETIRDRLRAQRLSNRADGLALSLRGMGTGAQPSYWEALPALSMPVRLLAGALDSKFVATAWQMHAAITHSTLAIVPAAGHTIHLEQPDAWLAHIR
jgi:2-succinyl-6-hydroxy-2,4-cyclohexadiene-1-carboxylate synthase